MPTTTADLSRAIYIDFEGHQDQAPALIGILVDDAFEIVVLDWRRTHPEVRPARRARRVRRRWSQRGGYSQEFFEKGVGVERPGHLVSGHVSGLIRAVRTQLIRRHAFSQLTTTAKGKWTKVLQYNEADVRNLARVMGAVAEASARQK
jgi:hypothetical protein